MKKFLIGSLLIGLSVSLFAADQCNGNNNPCDLTGTVIDDGTGSGYFVKYSGNNLNLKQYTTLNLVGSNKPDGYTVARHTNLEIVLNMSKKYGTIVTGYYTNGDVSCDGKPHVKDNMVDLSGICTNNISMKTNSISITPPTLRLSK